VQGQMLERIARVKKRIDIGVLDLVMLVYFCICYGHGRDKLYIGQLNVFYFFSVLIFVIICVQLIIKLRALGIKEFLNQYVFFIW
jgi:hypothetical protein